MRLGEKADDVGRHVGADAVHVEQAGAGRALRVLRRLHLAPPVVERAVMPRQQPRRRLADLRDAERVDEAVERDPPPLVDRGDQLAGADLAPAFALGDAARPSSRKMSPGRRISPSSQNSAMCFVAEPLDVEAVARDEMLQPLDRLRRRRSGRRCSAAPPCPARAPRGCRRSGIGREIRTARRRSAGAPARRRRSAG